MDYKNKTDKDLVDLYLENKSERLFKEIYNRTFDFTYKYVIGRVNHREIAEDIVEETFLIFLSLMENYSGQSKLSTYLIGIARNKIMQYWQKQERKPKSESEIADLDFLNQLETEKIEDYEKESKQNLILINKVLSKLKPNYQKILELRFKLELSYKQTAERLNMTVANVKVTQHRALKKAKEIAVNLLLE